LAEVFAFDLLLAGKHGFDVKEIVLENTKLIEPEYYRKSETLNVVGYYLKPGDEI
jgi:hypothetical protein